MATNKFTQSVYQKVKNGVKTPYTGLTGVKLVDINGVQADQTLTDTDTVGVYGKDGIPNGNYYLKINYGSGFVNPDGATNPTIVNIGECLIAE